MFKGVKKKYNLKQHHLIIKTFDKNMSVYDRLTNKVNQIDWHQVGVDKTSKRFLVGIQNTTIYDIKLQILDTIDWKKIFLNVASEGYLGVIINNIKFFEFRQDMRFLVQKLEGSEPMHHFEILHKYKEVVVDKICRVLGFDPEKIRYKSERIMLARPWKWQEETREFIQNYIQKEKEYVAEESKKPVLSNITWGPENCEKIFIVFDYQTYLNTPHRLHGGYFKQLYIFDCIDDDVKKEYGITEEYIQELQEHP